LKGQGRRNVAEEAARTGSYEGRIPPSKLKPRVFESLARLHPARKVDSVFCVASGRLRASGRLESFGARRVQVPRPIEVSL